MKPLLKGFKKFILDTHPDPDFAMGDFDQLCNLAENYRNKALDEAAQRATAYVVSHPHLVPEVNKQSILSLKDK